MEWRIKGIENGNRVTLALEALNQADAVAQARAKGLMILSAELNQVSGKDLDTTSSNTPPLTTSSDTLASVTPRLIWCESCRKQVSQEAASCPHCGHLFDAEAINRMTKLADNIEASRKSRLTEQQLGMGCLVIVAVLMFGCMMITIRPDGNLPTSSDRAIPRAGETEDEYVRRRMLEVRTPQEYDAAKELDDLFREHGVSDADQKRIIDAELRRRGELP